MAKEIEKQDIPKVKALLKTVFGCEDYAQIERMGGLTNHTYKVTLSNGEIYVVRIPGEGTEEMIVRRDEKVSTELACQVGIDAELLHFGEDGSKVTRYIPNAQTMSAQLLQQPEHIRQVAQVLKTIHTCGGDTKVPFEVFDMAESYEKIIVANQVPMYDDYPEVKARVMEIKAEIDAAIPAKKVPCHNDPLCENWVVGDGRMYLIDWEYAGMNDAMWDLADVSIEACFDEACDQLLLEAYLGHTPNKTEQLHFLASKIYVDYLWTLWAKTRVPFDGQSMEDWATERYTRLKGFVAQYDKI